MTCTAINPKTAVTARIRKGPLAMKKLYAFLIMTTLFTASLSSGSDELRWFSLQQGMEKAKAEKKPMIVDFYYGKGCHRCERLQEDVYDDPLIAKKIQSDFIPVRIDLTEKLTDEENKLGERFDYKDDCLLLFLDPDGAVLKDPKGKRLCFIDAVDPEWFIKYLDMIKAGSGK